MDFIPVYHFDINDLALEDGVSVMSIVDYPAVEKNFMKFSKTQMNFKTIDKDKKIITGVALRADYPIYREEYGERFYIKFSANSIEKIVHKFMKERNTKNVNINHSVKADDIYLFESFILNDNIKMTSPEFDDVSNGSWIVSYKVKNDKVWQQIKDGKLRGFSVEIMGEIEQFNVDNSEIKLYNILKELTDERSN